MKGDLATPPQASMDKSLSATDGTAQQQDWRVKNLHSTPTRQTSAPPATALEGPRHAAEEQLLDMPPRPNRHAGARWVVGSASQRAKLGALGVRSRSASTPSIAVYMASWCAASREAT